MLLPSWKFQNLVNGRTWGSSILDLQIKVSAACCARVSYLNHDGSVASVEKDLELYKTLVNSGHMTPLEHQATPVNPAETRQEYNGNFRGWLQHRKQLLNECRPFNYIGARAKWRKE